MKHIRIADRIIGDDEPCFVIAEIGVNHNGSMRLAKELIEIAAGAGADAVKFQLRSMAEVYRKETLANPLQEGLGLQYILELLREVELSLDEYAELADFAKKQGVIFMCTPFDKTSVDRLEELGVPAYKTASADMTNPDLIEYIAGKGKPLLVSTGMSRLSEIDTAVGLLRRLAVPFALLHCNSTYPAPFEDLNLRFIGTMKERYGVPVGYSGHERGISVSAAAVTIGASILERHFTKDRSMRGPDHAASLEPQGLAKLIRDIRQIELALGSPHRFLSQGEMMNRENLAKSLVAAKDIKSGEVITRDAIAVRSPGKGVSPQRIDDLVGKTAVRDIPEDSYFLESDFTVGNALKYDFRFSRPWGLIVRYHDMDEILRHADPQVIEFHFAKSEVGLPIGIQNFRQRLIVHAPELWDKDDLMNLCSERRSERERSIGHMKASIELTHRLAERFTGGGRPGLVAHVGGFDMDQRLDPRPLEENLFKSVAKLDFGDVEFLPENMPPFPWLFGGRRFHNVMVMPDSILRVAGALGTRICFDLSHAQLAVNEYNHRHDVHTSLEEFARQVAGISGHLHVADAVGLDGEGVQIGAGEIDFKRVLEIVPSDVSFVAEIWQGHKFGGEGFFEGLEALEKLNV